MSGLLLDTTAKVNDYWFNDYPDPLLKRQTNDYLLVETQIAVYRVQFLMNEPSGYSGHGYQICLDQKFGDPGHPVVENELRLNKSRRIGGQVMCYSKTVLYPGDQNDFHYYIEDVPGIFWPKERVRDAYREHGPSHRQLMHRELQAVKTFVDSAGLWPDVELAKLISNIKRAARNVADVTDPNLHYDANTTRKVCIDYFEKLDQLALRVAERTPA